MVLLEGAALPAEYLVPLPEEVEHQAEHEEAEHRAEHEAAALLAEHSLLSVAEHQAEQSLPEGAALLAEREEAEHQAEQLVDVLREYLPLLTPCIEPLSRYLEPQALLPSVAEHRAEQQALLEVAELLAEHEEAELRAE